MIVLTNQVELELNLRTNFFNMRDSIIQGKGVKIQLFITLQAQHSTALLYNSVVLSVVVVFWLRSPVAWNSGPPTHATDRVAVARRRYYRCSRHCQKITNLASPNPNPYIYIYSISGFLVCPNLSSSSYVFLTVAS